MVRKLTFKTGGSSESVNSTVISSFVPFMFHSPSFISHCILSFKLSQNHPLPILHDSPLHAGPIKLTPKFCGSNVVTA